MGRRLTITMLSCYKQSGEIIATSGTEETVVVAEIDCSKIEIQRWDTSRLL